ncbi:MAG: EamA family transporter [Gammaproteobacteria bacterium]|nr:EamA family transporter [Gammaproteobacteria bacterium]
MTNINAQSNENLGKLMVLGCAILWGTNGTAQALGPSEAQPLVLGVLRLFIGGFLLYIPVLLRGNLIHSFQPFGLILTAALGAVAYQVTFFSAVKITGVAVGTIVGIGSSPIFAGLLGWLIRGEQPGVKWFTATLIAIFGTLMIALSSKMDNVVLLGVVLALSAGLSYAVMAIAMKGVFQQRDDPVAVTGSIFFLGGVMMLPILLFYDFSWVTQPAGIAVVLYLGIITSGLAYWLFSSGLRYINVATAGTLSMGEPLTAGILGVLLLGERLSTMGWGGITLLIAALVMLTIPIRGKRVSDATIDKK